MMRHLLTLGIALCHTGTLTAESFLDWDFAANPSLAGIKDHAGTSIFANADPGLRVGNGTLLIQNQILGDEVLYAELPPASAGQPLWLLIEADGWTFDGRRGESLSFGFAWEKPSADFGLSESEERESDLAEVRMTRFRKERAYLDARAWGLAATNITTGQALLTVETTPAQFLLGYDPRSATYAAWYRKADGPWRILGQGATDARRQARYFRIIISRTFNDTPQDGVRIRRISITNEPPTGVSWPADPFITAASWAVADGTTGEMLGGGAVDTPAYMASVAKTMTAIVIADLAQKEPAILDEIITCAPETEDVSGSSSGLRSGDQVTVRDALYALMLPSGNDIAALLADSLSPRFDPPAEGRFVPAKRENFLAEMNRKAFELDMTQSKFRHPAFDPGEPGSTARDLLKLAVYAMKNPLFRQIVGTRSHTADITNTDGSKRTITWTNSNRLLGADGGLGIKTGSSPEAKSCLLSSVERNGHRYHVVVLGSTSYGRRYVDTMNALDWAEKKLNQQ